ncbi:unnamed protein product [Hermetia illucens]|uniref:Cuticle protein CPCFC domain-containing protein n=1 Tax=Hermetia illucens TaxID=343691 RepID=A0A7R8UA94_HERIL|nr:uncharacterized protein LOC119655507 [Hermetia illucens]CAD7076816.1 unnamed protein product [Hermetia illucens]
MFSKLASLISLIALATAAPQHQQPASQFPAGVNPALCPGFPICDNALLHNPQPAQQGGQWNPAAQHNGQWNPADDQSGQWNPAADQSGQWNPAADQSGQWNPAADQSGQWNPAAHQAQPQNQWNNPAPQWNAPAPNWAAPAQPAYNPPASNHLDGGDKYPAGINPQSCPNYPYCSTPVTGGAPAAPQVAPLPGYTERQYPAGVSAQQCPNFPYCS